MASNGRLPDSALSPISGGRLEHHAARAWNDMREFIGEKHGVWIEPTGPNSSYRTYAAQQYFWNLYVTHRGNLAAHPGTSNHGLGKAVDVKTPLMVAYIKRYGATFGWKKVEAFGEWWHYNYVGGYTPAKVDPLADLADDEKRLVKELSQRRRTAKERGSWTNGSRLRAESIKSWLRDRRGSLETGFKKHGNNWHKSRKRFDILGDVLRGKVY